MAVDLLLNMNISLNQLFKFVCTKYDNQTAVDTYRALKKIQQKPRKLELIPYTVLSTTEAIKAMEICCEYLSNKNSTWTFFWPLDGAYLYEVLQNNFKKQNPNPAERMAAIQEFVKTIMTLNDRQFFSFSTRNKELYNYLFSFNKEGNLDCRPLGEFLDILFGTKLNTNNQLLVNVL